MADPGFDQPGFDEPGFGGDASSIPATPPLVNPTALVLSSIPSKVWLVSLGTTDYLHGYFSLVDSNGTVWYYHMLPSAEYEPLLEPPAFGIDVTPDTAYTHIIMEDPGATVWYLVPLVGSGYLETVADAPTGPGWDLTGGIDLIMAGVGGAAYFKLQMNYGGDAAVVSDPGPGLDGDVQELVRIHFSAGSVAPLFGAAYWAPYLENPGAVTTSVLGSTATVIDTSGGVPRFGTVEMYIGSGAFDTVLREKVKIGKDLRIYTGLDTQDLPDFTLHFDAEMRAIEWDFDTARITIIDRFRGLDIPIQQNHYGGTGGLDGSAAMVGKAKPLTLGLGINVSPVLVDSNGASPIYQIHDGPAGATGGVHTSGVTLFPAGDITSPAIDVPSIYAWTPIAEQWVGDQAHGIIRLGVDPGGTLSAQSGTPQLAWHEIILDILQTRAGLALTDIDLSSITAVNASGFTDYRIELYIEDGSSVPIAQVITDICKSLGAFWYFTPESTWAVDLFGLSTQGTNAIPITDSEVLSLRTLPNPHVYWQVRTWHSRNYTVLKPGFYDTVLTDSQKVFFQNEYQYATRSDSTILETYPSAQVLEWPTLLYNAVLADNIAARLLGLFNTQTRLYEIELINRQFVYSIGQNVTMDLSRFFPGTATWTQILELTENLADDTTRMILWDKR